jgi:hypothetical protein
MPQDSRPFVASFGGRCAAECGDPIRPGEDVQYVADELMHAECAADTEGRVIRAERAEPSVCPSCWTVHAGECL